MSIAIPLLQSLDLFANLSNTELEMLRHHVVIHQRTLGDQLFAVDERARSCLCLVDGLVGVYLPTETTEEKVATIKPGGSVGHLALIDRKRRSATCRVISPQATILELTHETFDQLFSSESPLAFKIMDNLVMDLVGHIRENKDKIIIAKRERNEAKLNQKIGSQKGDRNPDKTYDELSIEDIEVCIPSLDQRMREKRDK
ncbi:MAG: cyclic nucleotide-binding domain-containing protein [Myxococcota bacterium]|nr:cyclic nucleotide-binding domain-containing protein [Myxococcota bacterium]